MDSNGTSNSIFVEDPAYHRFCLVLIPLATVIGNALVIVRLNTKAQYQSLVIGGVVCMAREEPSFGDQLFHCEPSDKRLHRRVSCHAVCRVH